MKSNAQIAYEAYCSHRGWKAFNGDPLPQWNDVKPDIKVGWNVAGDTVANRAVYQASAIWTGVGAVCSLVAFMFLLIGFAAKSIPPVPVMLGLACMNFAWLMGMLYGNWYSKTKASEYEGGKDIYGQVWTK